MKIEDDVVHDGEYSGKASSYLATLCAVKPNRRTGSPGNRQATDFFTRIVGQYEYQVDTSPFDCLDYRAGESSLTAVDQSFEIHVAPYSSGCDVSAGLATVSTAEELAGVECEGAILLMKGAICAEQLMPKGFVFYNPEHHKRIIALLESKRPAGIITATEKKPEQVGALYPFPLIVDGDFDIPNVYCKETVGAEIAKKTGANFRLRIDAERLPSSATNVIARKNPESRQKIVVTAHIDAYEDTPGASDNASGTVVLMLLAEMLAGYTGSAGIEIAALNGEDHYSAGGQMDYLGRYAREFGDIVVAINVDDVGYRKGRAAFSFYECPPEIRRKAEMTFGAYDGLVQGDPWFNGDHMIFVQNGVPSMAFTAEELSELMATITHTPRDTPEIVDLARLVEVARALESFIKRL